VYRVLLYRITPDLWRWEIRCGGTLFECGTAPTRVAAALHACRVAND
jgi:hypothetical protein